MRGPVDRRADLAPLDAPRIAVHDQQRRPAGLRVRVYVRRHVGHDHDPVGGVAAGHEGLPSGHREARLATLQRAGDSLRALRAGRLREAEGRAALTGEHRRIELLPLRVVVGKPHDPRAARQDQPGERVARASQRLPRRRQRQRARTQPAVAHRNRESIEAGRLAQPSDLATQLTMQLTRRRFGVGAPRDRVDLLSHEGQQPVLQITEFVG